MCLTLRKLNKVCLFVTCLLIKYVLIINDKLFISTHFLIGLIPFDIFNIFQLIFLIFPTVDYLDKLSWDDIC